MTKKKAKARAPAGTEVPKTDHEIMTSALICEGVLRVVATYSGYGDSGEFYPPTFYRGDSEEAWDAYDTKVKLEDGEVTLKKAVYDRLYAIVESQAGDWYNNEGGGGEFAWDVDKQSIEWDEYYNVTTSEHTYHDIDLTK